MVTIRWLGHAAFELNIAGKTILTDPSFEVNPNAPIKAKDIQRADFILISHGHYDHLSAEAIDIAKRTSAKIIAVPEVTAYCRSKGAEVIGRNVSPPFPVAEGLEVGVVTALHSSSIGLDKGEIVYAGPPVGYIIRGEGLGIYFAGDTGLNPDMRHIVGVIYKPQIALLPICGRAVMDPVEAAIAANWIRPRVVIPMHYDSLPMLPKVDPKAFEAELKRKAPTIKCVILKPGESYTYTK